MKGGLSIGSVGDPLVEALGLNGASKWTPAWRGCLTLVLRCRTGLPVDWGGTIVGAYLNKQMQRMAS